MNVRSFRREIDRESGFRDRDARGSADAPRSLPSRARRGARRGRGSSSPRSRARRPRTARTATRAKHVRRRVIVRAICELGRGLSRKRNFFARTDFFITSFGAARRDERARVDGGGLSPSRGVDRPARCKPALARSRASRSRRRSRALEPRVARASLRASAGPSRSRAREPGGPARTPPTAARGGSDNAGGGGGGGGGGGVIGWIARQFVNQVKCIPLLRWPRHGFFHPRTWLTTVADSVNRRPRSRRADRGVGGGGRRRREDL